MSRVAISSSQDLRRCHLPKAGNMSYISARYRKGEAMIERIPKKPWRKPELKPLGEIKDIAGAQGAGAQITVKT